MLYSAEHEIFLLIKINMPTFFLLINVNMPTIFGTLTFMINIRLNIFYCINITGLDTSYNNIQ